MKLKNILNLTVATGLGLLALVACNDLKGSLSLQKPLDVLDKKAKAVSIPAGSYESEFKFDYDKRKMNLKIKDVVVGSKKNDVELEIIVPADTILPRDSGAFAVKGTEVGQKFDLAGNLQTLNETSDQTSAVESCTYTCVERVCREQCTDRPGPDGKPLHLCKDVCGNENVTRTGSQNVVYHYATTTVSVDASLSDANDQSPIGKLSVSKSDSNKIYDQVGACIP